MVGPKLAHELRHEKNGFLPMQKQRRRPATAKLISAFVFAFQIVTSLFLSNSKFQASSTFHLRPTWSETPKTSFLASWLTCKNEGAVDINDPLLSHHICFIKVHTFQTRSNFVCLFVLRLNVPVNNFSVMLGRSQLFLGLTSTVGS